MFRASPVIAVAILGLSLAGCQTIGNPFDGLGRSSGAPTPLPSAPTKPVAATQLPPPEPAQTTAEEELRGSADPAAAEPGAAPAVPTQVANIALEREDLIGGWKITSRGSNCQLFLTLTGWTGGYRATTRGCSNEELGGVAAWDLNGKQVVLKGDGGTEVARLYPTGPERFDGQTAGSSAVSVFR